VSFRSILIRTLLLLGPVAPLWADTTLLDANAHYPEGPVWHAGQLLYVEYAGPGIRRWDGSHWSDYWTLKGCGPSGLAEFGHDHLLVACYDSNSLVELDEHAHAVRTLTKDGDGRGFTGPNDFAADGNGGVYFSASGNFDIKAPITGAVLHLSADGRTLHEVANTIHYSNGLTVSKDHKQLLVAEMLAGRILSFPILADGRLGVRSVWARLQDIAAPTSKADAYNGPDGLKLGPDGNYYIAQNGSGRVLVVNEQKQLVRTIVVPTPYVTNMGFGAAGTSAVYITGAFDPWKAPYPGAVYRWTP
jgi:gluconolactonase